MAAELLLSSGSVAPPTVEAKRQLRDLLTPGRPQLVGSAALATLATAATAAGFFAVAAVAQDVLDQRAAWPREWRWLVLLLGTALTRACATYGAARLAAAGALMVQKVLRARLLERLFSGPSTSLPSAASATAVMDEVDRVGAYAERYQPARVTAALVPILLLAAVFPLSWPVGLLLVLCTPLPPLNLSVVGMGTAAVARRHGDELRQLSGYFHDRLRGLATLRALGADRAELQRVGAASERLAQRSMAVLRVAFVSAAVLEAIVTVSVAVVAIYIGLTLLVYIHVPGLPVHMSLRTGLFLLMLTPLYFQPVRALAAAYHERADALAAVESLAPFLHPENVVSRRVASVLSAPPAVDLDHLTVTFPDRDTPALDDVSLRITPGELVGVTGSTGAGKSTLLRAIAGELLTFDGEVWLDGRPSTCVARRSITWLGQRPYLFSGTLADNIALGRREASEDEILDAALTSGLGDLLARLPKGIDTPVGEGGWGMSGGEAHRVALARTFLARAPLLLMDEPTAHLDAVSETGIVAVMRRLALETTTIVASHSPAVLAACERVVVLDRGRLLAPASAASLVAVVA